MIGDIFAIERLRMGTDGEGVSTLVAMFGCPLHCKYCINKRWLNFDLFGETPRAAYEPEELVKTLEKDAIYYLMTGGGVVFGGGEPLLQSQFIHEACKLIDKRWAKRIETSLNVPWSNIEPLINDIDEWIIDVKDCNSKIYEEYTGVSNKNVYDNLCRFKELIESGQLERESLHIRIPKIEKYNNKSDVEYSINSIKDLLGIEAEVFDYIF